MVGYVMSAASAQSCEDILIKAIDADDFAFVSNSCESAEFKYSRESRRIETLSKTSGFPDSFAKGIIYALERIMDVEEQRWQFPVALMWKKPEFGKLEIVRSELQATWPAVMYAAMDMECAYVNVSDVFFPREVRPLFLSFLCDVLNVSVFCMGISVDIPFCSCIDSVFCDFRMLRISEKLFGKDEPLFEYGKTLRRQLLKNSGKAIKLSKKRACRNLRNFRDFPEHSASGKETGRFLVEIKRECFEKCVGVISECIKNQSGCTKAYERLADCVSESVSKIESLSGLLLERDVITVKTDIHYLTFDDLLSAFNVPDFRMKLKSAVKIMRRKNFYAKNNKTPKAVLQGGRFIY